MNTAAIRFLQTQHDFLSVQSDLSPANEGVNQCLNQLVAELSRWHGTPLFDSVIADSECSRLREALPDLCAQAEGEMEKWWAQRILSETCPAMRALNSFWYMEHYKELCRDEIALLGKEKTQQVAFLGGGALPLTGLIMAMEQEDCSVRCIDCDEDACALAERLVQNLNLSNKVAIVQQRAEDFMPRPGETVIAASLLRAVGCDELITRSLDEYQALALELAHAGDDRSIRQVRAVFAMAFRSGVADVSEYSA